MQDPDYNCSQSDSDSGNAGEDANFKNVLLITGPVGVTTAILVYCIMCLLLVFFSVNSHQDPLLLVFIILFLVLQKLFIFSSAYLGYKLILAKIYFSYCRVGSQQLSMLALRNKGSEFWRCYLKL